MEVIYQETVNYAVINMVKNYCLLSEKHLHSNDDIFLFDYYNVTVTPKFKNRRVRFLHSNDDATYIDTHFKRVNKTFFTNDDKKIKKCYGKPFVSISIHLIERKITRNGDKLTIKLYRHTKFRDYNSIYFKRTSEINSITFNTKTGNITTSIINKNSKNQNKYFRVNNFSKLKHLLENGLRFSTPKHSNDFLINDELRNEFDKLSDHDKFINIFLKECGINDNSNKSAFEKLIDKFIEIKKIKTPDNMPLHLIHLFYPGETYLKKNNRKILNSILNKIGIKTKKTIRLLNENPNLDILFLLYVVKLLGENSGHYLKDINIPNFVIRNESDDAIIAQRMLDVLLHNNNIKNNINEYNRKKILKLLNDSEFLSGDTLAVVEKLNDVRDHINLLVKLGEYDVDVKFKFNNYAEFIQEHSSFSMLLAQLKKTRYGIKEFKNETIKTIEINNKYFDVETNIDYHFTFKLLTSELEYIDEGQHMHHCVASYFDRTNSVIVSIRDTKTKDRVTCEYDTKTGTLLQARFFCNQAPPRHFNEAIKDLTDKIGKLARKNLLDTVSISYVASENKIKEDNVLFF